MFEPISSICHFRKYVRNNNFARAVQEIRKVSRVSELRDIREVSPAFRAVSHPPGFAWVMSHKHRPSARPPRLQGLRNITVSSAGRPASTPCKFFASLTVSERRVRFFPAHISQSIRRREERRFHPPPSSHRRPPIFSPV